MELGQKLRALIRREEINNLLSAGYSPAAVRREFIDRLDLAALLDGLNEPRRTLQRDLTAVCRLRASDPAETAKQDHERSLRAGLADIERALKSSPGAAETRRLVEESTRLRRGLALLTGVDVPPEPVPAGEVGRKRHRATVWYDPPTAIDRLRGAGTPEPSADEPTRPDSEADPAGWEDEFIRADSDEVGYQDIEAATLLTPPPAPARAADEDGPEPTPLSETNDDEDDAIPSAADFAAADEHRVDLARRGGLGVRQFAEGRYCRTCKAPPTRECNEKHPLSITREGA